MEATTVPERTRPLRNRRRSNEDSGDLGIKKRQHGEIVCLGGSRRKRLLPDNMAASLALELHKYHYFIRISEEEGREEGITQQDRALPYYPKNSELYLTVIPLHERPYPWNLDQEPFRSCGLPPSIWKTGNPGYRARLEIRNMYIHYCHNENFRRFIDEENPSTAKALKYVREHRLQGTLVRGNYESSEERKMLLLSRVKKFNSDELFQARKKELAQRKSIMNLPTSARTPTCSQLYSTIQTILDADSGRVTKMLSEYQLPSRGGTRGRKLRLVYHVLDMYKEIVNQSSSDDIAPNLLSNSSMGQGDSDDAFLEQHAYPVDMPSLQYCSPSGEGLLPTLESGGGIYPYRSRDTVDAAMSSARRMHAMMPPQAGLNMSQYQHPMNASMLPNKHTRSGDNVFQFSFAAKPSSQSHMDGADSQSGEDQSSESHGPEYEQIQQQDSDRMLTPVTATVNPRSFSERRASIGMAPGYPSKEFEDSWGASDYECFIDAFHSDFDDTRDGGSREASRDRMLAAHQAARAAQTSQSSAAPDSPSTNKKQRR